MKLKLEFKIGVTRLINCVYEIDWGYLSNLSMRQDIHVSCSLDQLMSFYIWRRLDNLLTIDYLNIS